MSKVYAESWLAMIVAAGDDPHYGIPGVSSTLRTQHPSIKIDTHTLVGVRPPVDEIRTSRWNTRSWTYQEGLLSKRRFVFTDTQTYFQCQTMRCTDAIDISLEGPHPETGVMGTQFDNVDIKRAFPFRQSSDKPENRTSEFMRRNLSKDRDALDAIAGVLTAYNDQTYSAGVFCGLPLVPTTFTDSIRPRPTMKLLCEALAWSISCDKEHQPCFPSRTWAGWKLGKVALSMGDSYGFEYHRRTRTNYHCAMGAIEAEFVDGTMLSWEHQTEQVLELSRSGIHPVGLKITGWTFDCQVKWKQGDDRWCKFTHPQRLWRDGIEIRLSGVKQRGLRQLLGLILLNTEDGDVQFLIIEQQENGDRFERLDIGTAFKHNQLIVAQGPERALWADIELELKEICLV
jgi:hypothetical protein